jgi:phospholipase C
VSSRGNGPPNDDPPGSDLPITRRRTLQGLGAVLGSAAIGCGEDPAASGSTDGDTDSSSGDASTSDADGTTSGPGASSSGADTTGATADASSDGGESSGGEADDTTTGGPVSECEGISGLSPAELLAPIETIVVVVMENRSFDHYFGSATFREDMTFQGLTGDESNPDPDGNPVPIFNLLNLQPVDPPHSWDQCHAQWNAGANDGFVTTHAVDAPASMTEVMGYHVRGQLPVLYAMMDNYVVCDQWHASVMGPTWPNRFYLHAATSNGAQGNTPVTGLTTIWDVMSDAGLGATNYYSDVAWAWGAFVSPFASYTDSIDEFFDAAAAGTLPPFVIVDPNFGLLPGGAGGNDDHPTHDITLGQVFLSSIHQALASSPQWDRCLLIITYDEHGGFFDHVSPPTMPDPNPGFDQLGFRVPAIVAGPYVRRGCVDNTLYDHVSPIATATQRFGLPPINPRVTATNDVSAAINPEYLRDPQPPARIPILSVSVSDVLSRVGTGQDELADMIRRGDVPLPPDRRHPGASRDIALRMLERAQRLGVVKLRP